MRIKSGMYFYFSANVKKPGSFESGFLVFGAWRCRSATAVESHIANAHYHCVGGRYARPTYVISLDVSINCGMSLGYLLNPRQQKTRHIAATGFSYLEPGNVLLSHSKCYTIIGAVSFHY